MAENPLCPKTERERDEARAALSACQEELARVRQERDRFDDEAERLGIAKEEWRKDAEVAEAVRDELARAIERRYDGPGTADEAVAAALEAFYGKVSSEATKGET